MEYVACDFCGGNDTVEVTHQSDILHGTTDEIFTIAGSFGDVLRLPNSGPVLMHPSSVSVNLKNISYLTWVTTCFS